MIRNGGALIAAMLLLAPMPSTAVAQNVVVMVNGEPITALDIEQRMKLVQLQTQKLPPRQEVLNDLINEKLKIKEGKRWGAEIPDSELEGMYANVSSRMRLTVDQLNQLLLKAGTSPQTLKSRLRADRIWSQLVNSRYQSEMQINDKDVQVLLGESKPEDADQATFDYIMRPILFLVPPGSAPAVFESRRKEADALRARFKECSEGINYARTLRDLTVRDQVVRNTGDLTPELRKVLDAVPIGQLTMPEVTKLGIEMFAICGKQPSKADSPGKRKAREAVFSQRFERQSRLYLKQIRQQALIEYR
jgi:peptidyl-prolyl cis-trans isomerase SurA